MCKEQVVTFQGHNNYIVSIAQLCQESGLFTDVTLHCDDGNLVAHRLVLAAVSPFLGSLLLGPESNCILLPGISREVCHHLMHFLYTGAMNLQSQRLIWEMQHLVTLLQIDPQNVGVEVLGHKESLDLSKLPIACESLGIKLGNMESCSNIESMVPSPITNGLSPVRGNPRGRVSRGASSSPGRLSFAPIKVLTPGSRKVSERLLSPEGGSDSSLSPRRERTASPVKPVSGIRLIPNRTRASRSSTESETGDPGQYLSIVRPSENSNKIKIVTNRKRRLSTSVRDSSPSLGPVNGTGSGSLVPLVRSDVGRVIKRQPEEQEQQVVKQGRGGARARGRGGRRGRATISKGLHDMDNTQTWVCAICAQYDPQTNDPGETTEWIGCDCNRWFHKWCTKLRTVDDNFNCRQVHKVCLPH